MGQRSLTRCLQAWKEFFIFQLQPDPSYFNEQLKCLAAHLDEKISILIDWGTFARPIGHASGKIRAVDGHPDDASIPIYLIKQLLSCNRHEVPARDNFNLYRFCV